MKTKWIIILMPLQWQRFDFQSIVLCMCALYSGKGVFGDFSLWWWWICVSLSVSADELRHFTSGIPLQCEPSWAAMNDSFPGPVPDRPMWRPMWGLLIWESFLELSSLLRDLGNMVLSSGRMRNAMPSVVGTKGDRVPIWGLGRTHRQPFLEASHRLNHINF